MNRRPTIYEINTPIFLREMSGRLGYAVTFADVPDTEWDAIARPGIDTFWFMGVWKRSLVAIEIAKSENWLQVSLPDMTDEDLVGSAYSISDYTVDDAYGGNEGLAIARAKLKERGISLILDYVPNHVAIDHHWASEHADYFLPATPEELAEKPGSFAQTPAGIFAKGKDPHFEPWSDVLQLNAFSPSLRAEVARTLQTIANMCDGVRCDMAMLMMNTIFKQTWGDRAGDIPADDYWPAIIAAAKEVNPEFLFLAEVYWDMQQDLLDEGFDLCYDKDLYDYLVEGAVLEMKKGLSSPVQYQDHLMRFIENHDEERAAQVFHFEKHRAAAIIMATLPGSHLYHDGEREGRQSKLPVHLSRRVDEPVNGHIADFYDQLFSFVAGKNLQHKQWQLLAVRSGLWHRESHQVIAWMWADVNGCFIIVVNYSEHKAQANIDLLKQTKQVKDISNNDVNASEHIHGSRVMLDPWQYLVVELEK